MSRPGDGGPDTPPGPDAPIGPQAALPPAERGRLIRGASLAGTGVFAVTAGLAAAVDGGPLRGLAAAVAVAMFVLGAVAYLVGYAGAVQRSRTRVIGMAGLVFLADCAPTVVRRQLLGATIAQVVVALVTASIRPFTPLAFGVLAPVFGLGLQCLWAARHGDFPVRPAPRRPASSAPAPTARRSATQGRRAAEGRSAAEDPGGGGGADDNKAESPDRPADPNANANANAEVKAKAKASKGAARPPRRPSR